MKNLLTNNRPPGQKISIRLFLFVITFMSQTLAFGADTWIDPAGDNDITVESPSFRLQFRYYMDDGADSFWDSAPKLYINDQHIWTINELNIEGETRAHEIRDYDQDWISYEHNDYYIVLYDPYDRGDSKLWVKMEILPKRMKPGDTFKVQIKGDWCPNRNWDPTEYVTLDCPFTPKVPENIIGKMGNFTRPSEGVIRYNETNITPYNDKGFTWEYGFYKSSSYSDSNIYTRLSLPKDVNTTGSSIQWGGNRNDSIISVYTKTYLIRNDQPYGQNSTKKTGTIYFYKEYGKTDIDGFIKAKNLYAQPNMWDKSITLTWEESKKYSHAISTGNWLVWRYNKNEGESSKKIISTLTSSNRKYVDNNGLSYDTEYGYLVSFKPNAWNDNDYAKDLSSSDSEIIKRNYRMELKTTSHDGHVLVEYGGEELKGTNAYTYILSRKKKQENQWNEIQRNNVTNKKNVRFEYEDYSIENPCDVYEYRASIEMMDSTFYSNINTGKLLGTTTITKVYSTKGSYSNAVKLYWEVEQIGSAATLFNVYRRLLNDNKNDSWKEIYSTSGTDSKYSFEDVTANVGQYYEYKVAYCYPCDGLSTEAQAEYTEGFCLSNGVITGKINYATGTAAEGVKVEVVYTDEENKEVKAMFSSLRLNNGGGVLYETSDKNENKILYKQNRGFSAQMWVNIDEHQNQNDNSSENTEQMIFESKAGFGLLAKKDASGKFQLVMIIPDASGNMTPTNTDILVNPDVFHHYTMSYSPEKKTWNLMVIAPEEKVMTASFSGGNIPESDNQGVIFGKSYVEDSKYCMRGHMDEIRWWNKALTEKEVLKNYGHLLAGTEPGLMLYYPFDENITNPITAYDYSKTSDVPNEAHGQILLGAQTDDHVPTSEQFGLYAITDAEGNYTLRGIPITSEGVNYYIVPSKGTHSFTPNKVTRFLSANSMVHNNVDFTDKSSFAVRGVVYYKNTLHPVSGCAIKVDGELTMTADGEPSVTDENGEFTVSVPVGEHYITISKDGHTFENDGYYPAKINGEIQTMNFDREINGLTFTDQTLAVVAGRVSGGKIEHGKALGFGIGKANIGKAVIQLTTGYNMNMIPSEGNTGYEYNPAPLYYDLASDSIKDCKAYAGTSNEDGVRTITIETDPTNGEFAVLLPPAEYKITNATIPATGYKFEDLSTINVRMGEEFEKTDSIATDSNNTNYKYFKYHASLKLNQRNSCTLEVKDLGSGCDAFGEEYWVDPSISKKDLTKNDSILLYEVAKNGDVTYLYNYPIYFQLGDYKFDLYSYEQYVNMDDPQNPLYDRVPNKEALVTVNNEFGDGVVVDKDGTILQKSEREVVLDTLGRGTYHFKGGLPNIQGDYTLSMNISYEVDGNTLAWSENGKFKAILLGALPTGNNFVTKGPDKVLGVLRDPPGSNSYTRWEKGHTITNGWKTFGEWGLGLDIKTITSFGPVMASASGFIGAYVVNKLEAKFKFTVASEGSYSGNCDNTTTSKITLSEAISTSNSDSYVGGMADVFVGTGTNLTFGNARAVGFIMNSDSTSYQLGLKETMTMGEEFTTSFQYTQTYIETNVIPNLKKLRNAKLLPKGSPEGNNTNGFIYISKLEETDPLYGSSNYDEEIWHEKAIVWDTNDLNKSYDGPSYKIIPPQGTNFKKKDEIDSIQFYNNYINGWIYELWRNDSIKIAAINGEPYDMDSENESVEDMLEKYPGLKERNISFDGGTIYEGTWQSVSDETDNTTHKGHIGVLLGGEFGTNINGVGTLWDIKFTPSGGGGTTDTYGETETETTKFVLADNGFDAFTVDVYNRINEKSPIFYTRGGKSKCPYEGEVKSKYYEPEENHIISQATQKIEYPRITCDESIKMGVPSEEAAYFTIKLRNFSETNTAVWYDLELVEDSNPDGLEISMDGGPVNGSFFIEGGDSVVKTITMKQGNPSVRRYDDIRLRLVSQCQNNPSSWFGEIADTVSLSVEFVPACSDIRLRVPNPVLNKNAAGKLLLEVDRYDLNRQSLNGIEIQTKAINDTIWTTIKKYVTKEDLIEDGVQILDKSHPEDTKGLTYEFDMNNNALYPDGEYLFRAITICNFGEGDVHNESEEVIVVKDMVSPTIIATPSPADGVLNPGDEISIVFNENILAGSIDKNKIKVEGYLNETQIEHHTALKCDGNNEAATDAIINVSKRSFAVSFWMNYSQPGGILRHGTDNEFILTSVDEEHHLNIQVGNNTLVSKNTLPIGEWLFVNICYLYGDDCYISADIAYGDKTVNLFDREIVNAYNGNGRLSIGGGMVGSIHELTLWNYARSSTDAISEMYTTKRPQTTGLIGYWKFNEGRGITATDAARNRHMTLKDKNGWAMNNFNNALQLTEGNIGVIDIAGRTTSEDENYMIEFWFKGEQQADTASIMSVGNGRIDLRQVNENIELVFDDSAYVLTRSTCLDNQWHHLALNVLKNGNGSAIVYLDGTAIKQFPAKKFPSMAADHIYLGGRRDAITLTDSSIKYVYSQPFTGQFDEFRYWKGHITAEMIRHNMYHRIKDHAVGMQAYYPFETTTIDSYNQTAYVASLNDHSGNDRPDFRLFNQNGNEIQSATWSTDDCPPLTIAPKKEDIEFSYVTSERKLLIQLEEDAAQLEGNLITIKVSEVRDMNNNLSEDIVWSAYVQQNPLSWDRNEVSIIKEKDSTAQFTAIISNHGGEIEYWGITNLPSWLEVNINAGSLEPNETQQIIFTVPESTPVGHFEETIYLIGKNELSIPMVVELTSGGDIPNWDVNPNDFESSMSLIGQLILDGKNCENPNNIIAAFNGNTCVGTAHPQYIKRYDSYYVLMNIYGSGEEVNSPITIKVYDANTGIIYPTIKCSENLVYSSDKVVGSMDKPALFTIDNKMEQRIDLRSGWKWITVHVTPDDNNISKVMKGTNGRTTTIKDKNKSATLYLKDSWIGELTSIEGNKMYKVKSNESFTHSIIGTPLANEDAFVTLNEGWNWIGYTPTSSMSVSDAFSNANPLEGDVIKSQYAFSVFTDYEWIGTLEGLTPGEGYIYYSKNNRTFNYPNVTALKRNTPSYHRQDTDETYAFASNMNVIATVMNGEEVIADAHVYVYSNDSVLGRSTQTQGNDLHFLTIQGEEHGKKMNIVVEHDGMDIDVSEHIYFNDHAVLGTPAQPYVIQLNGRSNMNGITMEQNANVIVINATQPLSHVRMYDTKGQLVFHQHHATSQVSIPTSSLTQGAYIIYAQTTDGVQRTFKVMK